MTTDMQRFKIILPILKTRVEIRKDAQGNDQEVHFVQGVASSTDKDLHGDRMAPSAIKSMADSLKFHEVPLNADHDTTWSAEIGPIVKLEVSPENNLILEAELSEMSKAKDLWYALTEKKTKLGLSIGGYVKEYEMVKEDATDEESGEKSDHWYRLYKDIDLDHVAVTSSPANPKTWVSAISKSMDIKKDEQLMKAVMDKEDKGIVPTDKTAEEIKNAKDKSIKDLARKIARKIQTIEANLLLELTESILYTLDFSTVEKIQDYVDNILERKLSMKKTDTLEAEEALKKDDTVAAPESEAVETPAKPENESEEKPAVETPKEGDKTETPATPAAPAEEKPAEEKPVVSEPAKEEETEAKTEEPAEKAAPKDGDECTMPDGKTKGKFLGGKCTIGKSEDESGKEESIDKKIDEAKAEPTVPAVEKTEEKTEEKPAITINAAELLKSIATLSDGMKKILDINETLEKRVIELEKQPASRKTVEIEKGVGEDDVKVIDGKTLKQEADVKIAQIRKDNYGNPNLFAMIQKVRAEYSQKAQGK